MADKAATVYVVDLGASTANFNSGRTESDLDFALRYVWDRITTTVMNGRKTDTVGVVGFRTDETDNELMEDPSYANVRVLKPLGQCLMKDIRMLQKEFQPSSTDDGDGMSAIVVAIDMIMKYCRKLKYIKNIVYVTNGTGNTIDPSGLEDICGQMENENIKLTVIGVDFDDEEYGFKEEDKTESKRENEATLRTVAEKLKGVFGTCAEAIEELQRPRMKKTRPVTTFKGILSLGNPEDLENALIIDVEQYPKIMPAKPVSASSFTVATGDGVVKDEEGDTAMESVKADRVYTVEEEGAKKEIDVTDLDRGYMYGRAIVPISESERDITDFNASPGLDIVGFIPKAKYERFLCMTNCTQIVAKKDNPKGRLAMSSLIRAMYELECYGLGRFVASTNTKAKKAPVMCILVPSISIEEEYECLIKTELPFAEDVRQFRFPPLDHVKTTSGKTLSSHRLLPTPELQSAMDDLVDNMDLMNAGTDDDGNPCEYAMVEDVYSPLYHRINQVIKWRAVHPDEPIPEPYDVLVKYSHPPKELIEREEFEKARDKVVQIADVKKVPPKQRGFKAREAPKPLSGIDIDALLNAADPDAPATAPSNKVAPDNPIPTFKNALANSDETTSLTAVATSFLGVIEDTITHSFADANYERAIEMMAVLRSELIEYDAVEVFNELMEGFKERLTKGELGGERGEMWEKLRRGGLGLVKESEGEGVGVTEAEAKAFWVV